jgi:plastocyanin
MPNTKRLLAAVAAAVLTIAPAAWPASANSGGHAGLHTERVWFTCPDGTGISQLDGASTWTVDQPPEGDGCTSVDTGHHASSAEDTVSHTVFRGTFTGNLDSLTVRLHLDRLADGDMTDIAVGLAVDGKERVPWPTNATVIRTEDTPPGTVDVSVHRIGLLDEADDKKHELTLTLSLRGDLATGVWCWGSDTAPSGITFHPASLAETVIPARDDTAPPPEDPAALPLGPAVLAGPQSQAIGYFTPLVAMATDTSLIFGNADQIGHDVTSRARGADGKPLFRSRVTTTGATSSVTGADHLPPGEYDFYCSLHPNMTGTLHVLGG